jgi:hypothetical protein
MKDRYRPIADVQTDLRASLVRALQTKGICLLKGRKRTLQ